MADFVTSLYRGLTILKLFSANQPMLRLQEIINKTGLPKTTVLRFLRTLTELNYVQYNATTKQYFLGPETLSLGFAVLSSMDLRHTALPYIEELSAAVEQNIALGILDNEEVVCIERIKRVRIINIDLHVGARMNLYRSALGMAILAYLGEDEYKRVLAKLLEEQDAVTYLGPRGERLSGILQEVRERGYALNDNEYIPGILGIGAPILNYSGLAEGAISLPIIRASVSKDELIGKYVHQLVDTAKKISLARGYEPKS